MTRWDVLPAGAKVLSKVGGPESAASAIRRDRARNRARLLKHPVTDSADIWVPGLTPTTNVMSRGHWTVKADTIATWRAFGAALDLPAIVGTVAVEVRTFAGRRGGIGDAASRTFVVKAIIDGLADGGVLAEDDGRFVAYERYWAPVRADKPGLRLLLISSDC